MEIIAQFAAGKVKGSLDVPGPLVRHSNVPRPLTPAGPASVSLRVAMETGVDSSRSLN